VISKRVLVRVAALGCGLVLLGYYSGGASSILALSPRLFFVFWVLFLALAQHEGWAFLGLRSHEHCVSLAGEIKASKQASASLFPAQAVFFFFIDSEDRYFIASWAGGKIS
jgi:hypothetical protein